MPAERVCSKLQSKRRKLHDESGHLVHCARSWKCVYRIVLDCLIECWRRETRACRDPRRELPWPQESSLQLGLGLVASGTSPSKAVARAELRERMRQTLDLLKQADREILWMRHYDQLSFPEAAQILGLSESAATLRYVRAVKRLKKLWQDLYPDASGGSRAWLVKCKKREFVARPVTFFGAPPVNLGNRRQRTALRRSRSHDSER